MIEGIDISAHQATTPSLAGKAFVICRATYGAHGDSRYLIHAQAVRKAGKVLGAYHFARPVTTGDTVAEQVRAFMLMGRDADLLVLDWESDGGNGRMTVADAKAFIAAVHKQGRRIGLYASESTFRDLGQDFDWVANWSREPRSYDIWQYRGSPLDLDRFRGTVAQLRALGVGELPDTGTETSVKTTITILPYGGGHFVIPAGKTVTGFKLDGPGGTVSTTKSLTAPADGTGADYDALMDTEATRGEPFIRVSTGALAGFFIGATGLQLTPNQPPAPPVLDCAAAVQTALESYKAGEVERTRTAIEAAIQADRAKARVGVVYTD